MPTCPGCKRHTTHANLRAHLEDCAWIWSETPERETQWGRHLARELRDLRAEIDRLDGAGRRGVEE